MTTFLKTSPYQFVFDESSPFSDGQPHVRLMSHVDFDLHGHTGNITLKCRISSALDLFNIGLAVDIIRHRGPDLRVCLEILYLWGRMDRRISQDEPYTLRVLCDFINSLNLHSVSVFCPHSQATTDLLKRYIPFSPRQEDCFFDRGILSSVASTAEEWLEWGEIDENVKAGIRNLKNLSFVYPDAGAGKRFAKSSLLNWYPHATLVTMHKDRDERTGKILGTRIIQGEVKNNCVILDDLCDGGATFKAAAAVLREAGAKKVSLVVPHGIFSKGTVIEGIDYVFTSNSFKGWEPHETLGVHRFV